jgi:subtilisin-like proprotein convertase family protein
MKSLAIAAGLAAALAVRADDYILSSGAINTLIPDASVSGLSSTLPGLSGEVGYITNVTVTVQLSGGYNGDLYAYIAHSSGFSVLLNRVGRTSGNSFGYGDAGFSVTFSDIAASDIHLYGGNGGSALTGTYQPDARNFDPALALDTTPRSAYLNSFNNLDPNGSWTLFLADMSGGEQTTLNNWQVNVSTVPEPGPIALGATALALLLAGRYLRLRKS